MSTNLLDEDIQVLKTSKGIDWDDLYWGFTCYSRQNYAKKGVQDFDDEIIYGVFARSGGCLMEMQMLWDRLAGNSVPRLKVYSDALTMLDCPTHKKLISRLASLEKKLFTPDEFSRLLLSIGFEDNSDNQLPAVDESEIAIGSYVFDSDCGEEGFVVGLSEDHSSAVVQYLTCNGPAEDTALCSSLEIMPRPAGEFDIEEACKMCAYLYHANNCAIRPGEYCKRYHRVEGAQK